MSETTKTQKEVALRCGIGLSTVFHYVRIGKLTSKKISKRVTVFSIDEVDKLFTPEVA